MRKTRNHPDQGPTCNGLCVTAEELGVPTDDPNAVAYQHPDCELHGDNNE